MENGDKAKSTDSQKKSDDDLIRSPGSRFVGSGVKEVTVYDKDGRPILGYGITE